MGILHGQGGAVKVGATVGSTVANWSISHTRTAEKVVAGNTDGGPARVAGNKDWSGQFKFFGKVPPTNPTDSFVGLFSVDAAEGYSGTARCSRVTIGIDVEGATPIGGTASFEANGALTAAAAVAVDASVPAAFSSVALKAEIGTLAASPAYTEVLDVRSMDLEISAENASYVSSSTAGQTKREGGNIDATVSISVYVADLTTLPDVGDIKILRLYVDATTYWELKWCHCVAVTDVLTDPETNAIIGCTHNWEFSGWEDPTGGVTQGHINKPGAVVWWGV